MVFSFSIFVPRAALRFFFLIYLGGFFRFRGRVRDWVSSPGHEADMSIGLENFTLHRKGCSHSTLTTGLI
jgi:hypothetical protein